MMIFSHFAPKELMRGFLLCVDVINSAHSVSFHLHVEENEAEDGDAAEGHKAGCHRLAAGDLAQRLGAPPLAQHLARIRQQFQLPDREIGRAHV